MELLRSRSTLEHYMRNLSEDDLRAAAGSMIFSRGEDYFNDGCVGNISIESSGEVHARVSGSYKYNVRLVEKSSDVHAKCSCPYASEWGGICKHIVAVLLEAIETNLAEELALQSSYSPFEKINKTFRQTANPNSIFEKYLDSLSTEELKELVRKLATNTFRKEIELKHGSSSLHEDALLKAKKKINNHLAQDWQYEFGYYEPGMMEALNEVRGVWNSKPDEVCELLTRFINRTDELMEEGGLYSHDYGEDAYENEEFVDYCIAFVNLLPVKDKVKNILNLYDAINGMSYGVFDDMYIQVEGYLTPDIVEEIKPYFLSLETFNFSGNEALKIYELLSPALTEKEMESLLTEWHGVFNTLTNPVIAFFEKKRNPAKALSLLEDKIKNSGAYYNSYSLQEDVHKEHIRLRKKLNVPLNPAFDDYIRHVPKESVLLYLETLVPERKTVFESISRERSLTQ
ncbi:MAG: hypothetical protein ACI9V1_000448 [Spirosomataceae bacterium]|jgi:hypothetical protein